MSEAVSVPSARTSPAVQRAYVYVVALVAVHMIVLGVANILRVLAEIALSAPSGGFTGLPFLFAEFSRPREQYREQASLAIALLLVGTPAWWIHFRLAARAAAREVEERTSALRSLYVHLVIFVTALLVFGYGQRALRLVLQGTTFSSQSNLFGLEASWEARAAGAGAMALTAAVVLVYHLRASLADRRAATIRGRAAEVRHIALYALVVVGLFFAAFTTVTTLDGIWRRVADAFVTLPGLLKEAPPGVVVFQASRDDALRFQLIGAVPAIVAGLALWLGTWLPLQRGLMSAPDAEIERRSLVRGLAIYIVVFVSAVAVLVAATFALSSVGRRLLGDPVVEQYNSLWHELGVPVTTFVVFGALWIFHRSVVEREAARETEVIRAATIRRLYTYLISAIGLAMAAIGTAGSLGVVGSQVLGMNTHANGETAAYLSLTVVGAVAWAYHWRQARRRLDDDERRSQPRRLYLYLAVLGGILGLLVFGSAALYRLLNATLAFSFTLATWHDVWHFAVDSGVSAAAFLAHFRVLRGDRAATAAADAIATPETYAFLVRLGAADRDAARARLTAAVPEASIVPVRSTPDGPGAVSLEALTPIEQGPSIVAVAAVVLAALLVLPALFGLLIPRVSSPPPAEPHATTAVAPPAFGRGAPLWSDPGRTLRSDDAAVVGREVALPAVVEMVVAAEPGTDMVLEWTLHEDAQGPIVVRFNAAVDQVDVLRVAYGSGSGEGQGVPVPGARSGRPVALIAYLDGRSLRLDVDGAPLGKFAWRDEVATATVRVATTTGRGAYVIRSVSAFEGVR